MREPIKFPKLFPTSGRSQPNISLWPLHLQRGFFWLGGWLRETLFSSVSPSNSLVLVSNPTPAFSSEVLPLKGSQPQRVCCFQNYIDTWTMLIRRRRPMALSRITEANLDFEIVENARVFVFQKFCGPPQSTSLIYKLYNYPLTSLFGARASKKISLLFFLV